MPRYMLLLFLSSCVSEIVPTGNEICYRWADEVLQKSAECHIVPNQDLHALCASKDFITNGSDLEDCIPNIATQSCEELRAETCRPKGWAL